MKHILQIIGVEEGENFKNLTLRYDGRVASARLVAYGKNQEKKQWLVQDRGLRELFGAEYTQFFCVLVAKVAEMIESSTLFKLPIEVDIDQLQEKIKQGIDLARALEEIVKN